MGWELKQPPYAKATDGQKTKAPRVKLGFGFLVAGVGFEPGISCSLCKLARAQKQSYRLRNLKNFGELEQVIKSLAKEDSLRLPASEVTKTTSFLRNAANMMDNLGYQERSFGDSVAISTKSLPWFAYNRIMNTDKKFSDLELDLIQNWYQSLGIPYWLETYPSIYRKSLISTLSIKGFRPAFFHNVLYGYTRDIENFSTGLDVIEIQCEKGMETYCNIFVRCYEKERNNPDKGLLYLSKVMKTLHGNTDWKHYIVLENGTPFCAGSLFAKEGVATLAGAFTDPDFRKRGGQTALLAKRISVLSGLDCDLVCGQVDPGSASQRNLERAGLRVAYTRTAWKAREISAREDEPT